MRQEALKKRRGRLWRPTWAAHTRAGTDTHTHTKQCLSFISWPKQAYPEPESPQCPQFEYVSLTFVLPLVPFFLFLMPLRFVTFSFLVLSLFKCQLHSTFIQICVARICLDIARQYTPYILYIYIYSFIYL